MGTLIPSWWQLTLLALAAFRVTRLAGWDDFPLAIRARCWLTGWYNGSPPKRPTLAHFLSCPFCVGFWISVAFVAAWWLWPRTALIVCTPFAVSSLVGLVAKNLDA